MLTIDRKAKTVTVTLPLQDPPSVSSSGKSLVLASTHGAVRTEQLYDDKIVTFNVNVYVKA